MRSIGSTVGSLAGTATTTVQERLELEMQLEHGNEKIQSLTVALEEHKMENRKLQVQLQLQLVCDKDNTEIDADNDNDDDDEWSRAAASGVGAGAGVGVVGNNDIDVHGDHEYHMNEDIDSLEDCITGTGTNKTREIDSHDSHGFAVNTLQSQVVEGELDSEVEKYSIINEQLEGERDVLLESASDSVPDINTNATVDVEQQCSLSTFSNLYLEWGMGIESDTQSDTQSDTRSDTHTDSDSDSDSDLTTESSVCSECTSVECIGEGSTVTVSDSWFMWSALMWVCLLCLLVTLYTIYIINAYQLSVSDVCAYTVLRCDEMNPNPNLTPTTGTGTHTDSDGDSESHLSSTDDIMPAIWELLRESNLYITATLSYMERYTLVHINKLQRFAIELGVVYEADMTVCMTDMTNMIDFNVNCDRSCLGKEANRILRGALNKVVVSVVGLSCELTSELCSYFNNHRITS